MSRKTAFITGIAGQDGAYLAEFLLGKGYDVHGLVRWDSHLAPDDAAPRLRGIDGLRLHIGDLTDGLALARLIKDVNPDEIYNLAALSQVAVSFETPASTLDINVKGSLNIFEVVRVLDFKDRVRIYQASSSEMFGSSPAPQDEGTPMLPCSPYGVSKLAGYHLARIYREAYGMHISNGILFNHESPLRGEDFVTRKITRAVAGIAAGRGDVLILGNLDALRDWGYAGDYVRGMWAMVQHDAGDDYVLASGQAHSVRAFVEAAFAQIGVALDWCGVGADETGVDAKTGETLVRVDPALYRPKEVNHLCGDASKARRILGWQPETSFADLVGLMVRADVEGLQTGEPLWRMVG
ncbi:MAG: GDP-mannose 4,6-dehydratase [Bdellovibrionales bacterium]